MHRDPAADLPTQVCTVGTTRLTYRLGAIVELHASSRQAADEQKPAKDGTVMAWGRDACNPVGGWYGLRKGYRGRFRMYLNPLLEELGPAELEHHPRNNRVRAK